MELPILDLQKLPNDFRKAFATSLNVIRVATSIYNGEEAEKTVIPITLRTEYINLYNMHLGVINMADIRDRDKELEAFKKRFDVFANGTIKISIRDKLATMVEFSQIVSTIIFKSYNETIKNSNYHYASTKKYSKFLSAKSKLFISILNAYKLALTYSRYRDESLIDKISPYLINYLNIDPFQNTNVAYPDFGGNYQNAQEIKIAFDGIMTDIIIYERKINLYSKYIDSNDLEYTNTLISHYKKLSVNYLTYPKLYIEEAEKSL